jgi:glutathione S-transferase
MTSRLITIPFSHYCEKARWALDRAGISYDEDGHLPAFHRFATRRARANSSVPALVLGDRVIKDSTDIVAWAETQRPGAIALTDEAVALEDYFDRQLGPATRRWAYFQLFPRRDLDFMLDRGVPRWEVRAFRLTRPVVTTLMRRAMNITPDGVNRSRKKIDEAFGRVGEILRDGRHYLTGDRFTVADLTFASLCSPILLPREHPFGLPTVDDFTGDPRRELEAWRTSVAGAFALRVYAEDRTARA